MEREAPCGGSGPEEEATALELPDLTFMLNEPCLFTDYKKLKEKFNKLFIKGATGARPGGASGDSAPCAENSLDSDPSPSLSPAQWKHFSQNMPRPLHYPEVNFLPDRQDRKETNNINEYKTEPDSGNTSQNYQLVKVKVSGLDDIVGLEDVKKTLRESVIYPIIYPQLFTSGGGSREAWSRALLFGAPGVGKTALVQAVAAEASIPLYCSSSADLLSAWFGNSEKHIRAMFKEIGSERCILFIDEIDSLCGKRASGDNDHTRRMQTELMVQMENYEGAGMFLLCATNCPWDIDSAFMRRFQQRIYVPMPNKAAREGLFLKYLRLGPLPQLWPEWSNFLKHTDGLTGSDIRNIVRTALMKPLGELQEATHWQVTNDGRFVPCSPDTPNVHRDTIAKIPPHKVWCRQATITDLWLSLENFSKTITSETMEPFQQFIKDHAIPISALNK